MKNLSREVWNKIAPTWPLSNVIACNPLQGFEDLEFEDALKLGVDLFANKAISKKLEKVNLLTIKWCQVFFDVGQATIKMPNRQDGFYKSIKELLIFDDSLNQNSKANIDFIKSLSDDSSEAILEMVKKLEIPKNREEDFLTLLLTTLSGWSAYVKYMGEWSYQKNPQIMDDYLAIRLLITSIIWPNAGREMLNLLEFDNSSKFVKEKMIEILSNEKTHQQNLINSISKNINFDKDPKERFDAQLVFCIDVRSEMMRKAIESCGNYETFGFAGFFGIPTTITSSLSGDSYASCPVLLEPKHDIVEHSTCSNHAKTKAQKGYSTLLEIKKFYQALKYNFTTPLPLAEGMGIWSGGWMFVKTFSPRFRNKIQNTLNKTLRQNFKTSPEIASIPFENQCSYALGFLKAVGLTKNFSKIILLCGHGSQTENNTYATALDCGACGGRHGDSNAKILAKILSQKEVRNYLKEQQIEILDDVKFIAAKHNTTTDEIEIYPEEECDLAQIKKDLLRAKEINNLNRSKEMGVKKPSKNLDKFFFNKSYNWSETQPEWGLARNASFIVAPRSLTKNIDLKGRSFLHSYDWRIDEDSSILNLILNAPMIVAQWINSQYLFSTIDNVAFGSGSKITQNIVGKIGVMQGNGSDLMHGLPLQSVFRNDEEEYHQAARLATFIYAPLDKISGVVENSPKVESLISNEWIMLYCLDPRSKKIYKMQKNSTWSANL